MEYIENPILYDGWGDDPIEILECDTCGCFTYGGESYIETMQGNYCSRECAALNELEVIELLDEAECCYCGDFLSMDYEYFMDADGDIYCSEKCYIDDVGNLAY